MGARRKMCCLCGLTVSRFSVRWLQEFTLRPNACPRSSQPCSENLKRHRSQSGRSTSCAVGRRGRQPQSSGASGRHGAAGDAVVQRSGAARSADTVCRRNLSAQSAGTIGQSGQAARLLCTASQPANGIPSLDAGELVVLCPHFYPGAHASKREFPLRRGWRG